MFLEEHKKAVEEEKQAVNRPNIQLLEEQLAATQKDTADIISKIINRAKVAIYNDNNSIAKIDSSSQISNQKMMSSQKASINYQLVIGVPQRAILSTQLSQKDNISVASSVTMELLLSRQS